MGFNKDMLYSFCQYFLFLFLKLALNHQFGLPFSLMILKLMAIKLCKSIKIKRDKKLLEKETINERKFEFLSFARIFIGIKYRVILNKKTFVLLTLYRKII